MNESILIIFLVFRNLAEAKKLFLLVVSVELNGSLMFSIQKGEAGTSLAERDL